MQCSMKKHTLPIKKIEWQTRRSSIEPRFVKRKQMRIEISGRIAEIVQFDTLNPYDLHKYHGNLYIQSIEKEAVF